MVSIQAQIIFPATPQRTAESLLVDPTPTIAPVMVWVVLTGIPATVAPIIEQAAAVMQLTPGYLVSVAGFYDMLDLEPVGRNTAPAVAVAAISAAASDPDAIILASRWVRGGGFDGYGRVNKALNFIFNKMLQVLFWTKVKDLTYGYRFAPVDKTLSVKWESTGFSIGMETNLRMLRLGYPIIEVPAMWRVRKQGDSQNSFFTKCKYINTVLKVRFARKDSNKSAEPRES